MKSCSLFAFVMTFRIDAEALILILFLNGICDGLVDKAPFLPGECEEPAEQAQGSAASCHRGGGVPAGQLTVTLHLPEACRLDTS